MHQREFPLLGRVKPGTFLGISCSCLCHWNFCWLPFLSSDASPRFAFEVLWLSFSQVWALIALEILSSFLIETKLFWLFCWHQQLWSSSLNTCCNLDFISISLMAVVVQVGICKETSMEKAKLLPGMPGCWWHLCCCHGNCVIGEFIPHAWLVPDLNLPGCKLTFLSLSSGFVFLIQVFL